MKKKQKAKQKLIHLGITRAEHEINFVANINLSRLSIYLLLGW